MPNPGNIIMLTQPPQEQKLKIAITGQTNQNKDSIHLQK